MKLGDPAAQPERTALAWSRTALALITVGLLCVRLAPSPAAVAIAAVVVCGGAMLLLRRARTGLARQRRKLASGGGTADPLSALVMSGLVVLLAMVAILFALN